MNAEGGLQIHHVILKTAFDDLIMLESRITVAAPCIMAHSMEGKNLQPLHIRLITGKNHSALPGTDILGRVKTEAAKIAQRSRHSAAMVGFDSVGAILNEF